MFKTNRTAKAIVLTLSLITPFCAFAQEQKFVATEADKTFQAMVTRWASMDNKVVFWSGSPDFEIKNFKALNSEARFNTNGFLPNMEKAFNVVGRETKTFMTVCTYKEGPYNIVVSYENKCD